MVAAFRAPRHSNSRLAEPVNQNFLANSDAVSCVLTLMSQPLNRIDTSLSLARQSGDAALIPYLTAGFPSPARTLALMEAIERGGADVLELGVPFSDPIADGPIIQKACAEALAAGTSLAGILDIVRQFRRRSQLPLVLFGAYNPFFHYGFAKFVTDAAAAGVDGILVPDLPLEESGEVEPVLRASGLHLIYLVAPTTPADRKHSIAKSAGGFIYYISVKGVTGQRSGAHFELEKPLGELRAVTQLPLAVGFGIGAPAQAAEVGAVADAAVVGSALVDLIGRNREAPDLTEQVEAYIRSMKEPLRGLRKGR